MSSIVEWLSGRKTNLTAAATVTLAITAIVNGWGEAEIAALAVALGTIAATLRAAAGKPVVLTGLAAAVLIGAGTLGCANLSKINPETGQSYAQDLQDQVTEFSMILPPPYSTIIPAIAGLGLFGAAIVGKSKEIE